MSELVDQQGNRVNTGTHGWQGLHAMKLDMLYQYELSKKYQESHKVKVHAGKVAEAIFRKWLASFLPKRWGVCSGRIISQGQTGEMETPHYDVIIYDQLSSPVLWIEDTPDASSQGKSLAIPAEYVGGVIEVKSSLTSRSAQEAKAKIIELRPFLGIDKPDEKYRQFFPHNFSSQVVYFEDKTKQKFQPIADNHLDDRGYKPPTILKITEDPIYSTMFDSIKWGLESHKPVYNDDGSLNNFIADVDGRLWNLIPGSSRISFQSFAFRLIKLLEGTYRPGWLPSMYAQPPMSMKAYNNAKELAKGKRRSKGREL